MPSIMYPDEVREWITNLEDLRDDVLEHKGALHNHPQLERKVAHHLDEIINSLQGALEES